VQGFDPRVVMIGSEVFLSGQQSIHQVSMFLAKRK
jgi:hypothetical protein